MGEQLRLARQWRFGASSDKQPQQGDFIEDQIKDRDPETTAAQGQPLGLTAKANQYMRNRWELLIGYCQDGRLHLSIALAENVVRPFAVGRRDGLFADTACGARASATCYSRIETAKANGLEP